MLRDHCPVCLSVTLVYCGQTVGWIKVPLSMEVGLGPGNIVLDRDPAASAKKGQSRSPKKEGTAPPPTFRPISIVAKWLDGSGYHLVRRIGLCPGDTMLDGDPVPPTERAQQPHTFWPMSIAPNGRPSQQQLSSPHLLCLYLSAYVDQGFGERETSFIMVHLGT